MSLIPLPVRVLVSALCLNIVIFNYVLGADNCEQYARDAVAASEQNISQGCGLSGPRWTSDFNGHFNWCVNALQSSVDSEAGGRAGDLANCGFCRGYASEAVAAQQKNLANGCNLTGPRWTVDFGGHFRWCMEAQRSSVEQEARFRNFDAQKCEQCTQYSRMAVAANATNVQQGCGYAGPQWTADYGGHFNWCWNLETRSSLGAETANRQNLLNACANSANRRAECDAYARRAVEQFGVYRQRNCGGLTAQWGDNYQNHYGWCLSASTAAAQGETRSRDDQLSRCAGSVVTPPVSCTVSVVIQTRDCVNSDGTPTTIVPGGSTSAIGCGATQDVATAAAKLSLAQQLCLTDGDHPARGCCTYTLGMVAGCLCH